jgi:hypothetical protein
MKVTVGQVIDSYEAWTRLAGQVVSSAETKYRLIRVAIAVEKIVNEFKMVQLDLLKACGKPLGGDNYKLVPEKTEHYNTELAVAKDRPVTIPGKCFTLKSLESLEIWPLDVAKLSWLIEEPEADPADVEEEVKKEE